MPNTFFTADTHLGHERTLVLSKRPFANVTEMDDAIINNWNRVVKSEDTVYHLGDFGTPELMPHLMGNIIFLPGNYERDQPQILNTLAKHCTIIKPNTIIDIDGTMFQLVHEPDSAKKSQHFFLFGHIHKLQMIKQNGLNVGVDCHNFTPLSIDDVLFYRDAVVLHYDENVFQGSLGID